ncbi:MAG TPA: hypothetical protein VD999_00235 [Vitreimonas sp.]|nr:hypothetical protein [Vitreimonas sp.]
MTAACPILTTESQNILSYVDECQRLLDDFRAYPTQEKITQIEQSLTGFHEVKHRYVEFYQSQVRNLIRDFYMALDEPYEIDNAQHIADNWVTFENDYEVVLAGNTDFSKLPISYFPSIVKHITGQLYPTDRLNAFPEVASISIIDLKYCTTTPTFTKLKKTDSIYCAPPSSQPLIDLEFPVLEDGGDIEVFANSFKAPHLTSGGVLDILTTEDIALPQLTKFEKKVNLVSKGNIQLDSLQEIKNKATIDCVHFSAPNLVTLDLPEVSITAERSIDIPKLKNGIALKVSAPHISAPHLENLNMLNVGYLTDPEEFFNAFPRLHTCTQIFVRSLAIKQAIEASNKIRYSQIFVLTNQL